MHGGGRDRRSSTIPTRLRHLLITVLCSVPSRDAFLILSPLNRLSVRGTGNSKSSDHVVQSQRGRALGAVGAVVEQENHQEEERGATWPVVAPISSASLLTSFKVRTKIMHEGNILATNTVRVS